MTVTPAIRNMIRDNKIPQIDGLIYSSANNDLISMDTSLLGLYKDGKITEETALTYATNPEMLKRRLSVMQKGEAVHESLHARLLLLLL